MRQIISLLLLCVSVCSFAQTVPDSISSNPQNQKNAVQRIMDGNVGSNVTVGGYGEIVYYQPEGDNGKVDVQRLVLFFGYKFNDKVQFVTEVEVEHVKQIEIEQAFIQYSLNDNINLRGGLMLVPMGIVNEYHEPTTFNGVQRPGVDTNIVPSTWREIGVGVAGSYNEASLRYQLYMFNGFASTDGVNTLGGAGGLREGRQNGILATVSTPSFSGKLDYYGMPGLRLGLAGYYGKSQAEDEIEDVDGATVGIAMVGLDARYAFKRFTARGEFIYANISDSEAYNNYYGADLGSALQGWYLEGGFNLLPLTKVQQLYAFARYEDYDTHASVSGALLKNGLYDRNEWTFGLSYNIAPGAVVKADYQLKENAVEGVFVPNQFNVGLGVWF